MRGRAPGGTASTTSLPDPAATYPVLLRAAGYVTGFIQRLAAEVGRRRIAGEGFDRLAREMKVSRGTVLRAYDFPHHDEAAAAAREGRKPSRSACKWSEESRAAKRKRPGA